MSYVVRRIAQPPNPWLFVPRPTRGAQIVGAQLHSSRSGRSSGDDGPRTEGYMWNTGNGSAAQGWGGSCDEIIFEDGTRVVVSPDVDRYEPTYDAGFGLDPFTWSCGWYYKQYELAQGVYADAFTDAQYDSLGEALAEDSKRYGFPLVWIPWIGQKLGTLPPPGVGDHEHSDNGRKLVKSDVGASFDRARALASAQAHRDGGEMLTPEDIAKIVAAARAATLAEITELCTRARLEHGDGSFVRGDGTAAVYEIVNGSRVWLLDPAIAVARGMHPDLSNVAVVHAAALNAWPERSDLD